MSFTRKAERRAWLSIKFRLGLVAMAAASLASMAISGVGAAHAGQQGGSILYTDREARTQDLEFRALVWHARTDYYHAVVDYREVGSPTWKDLDENWGWTRGAALAEITRSARYIARDGYIWRFKNPTDPPGRAVRLRFSETCWRVSLADCVNRLKAA